MSTLTTTIDLEQIHILGDHAIRALPELTEVTTKWLINKDPVEGCSTIRSRISRMSGRKPMTGQIVEEIAFGNPLSGLRIGPLFD